MQPKKAPKYGGGYVYAVRPAMLNDVALKM